MVWPGLKVLMHVLKVKNSTECAVRAELYILYTACAELHKSYKLNQSVYALALPCLK